MVPAANGEDRIVYCEASGYAANLERAETGRKAAKIETPKNAGEMKKVSTPGATSIEQVSRMLKLPAERFVKTLIYSALT